MTELPYKILAGIVGLIAAFIFGVHWGSKIERGKQAEAQLEDTQEAQRLESARASKQQEAINGYIQARNAAASRERAAAADLERLRNASVDAEQLARSAPDACADLAGTVAELQGLLRESAGLVEEGGRYAAELADKASALQRAAESR